MAESFIRAGQDYADTGAYIPAREFAIVRAAEAITKAHGVTPYDSSPGTGYTVGTRDVWAADAVASRVVGIAMETAAAGAWFTIQTKGRGVLALTTDGNAVALGALCPTTAAGTFTGAIVAATTFNEFGYLVADDASTTLAAASYVLNCFPLP